MPKIGTEWLQKLIRKSGGTDLPTNALLLDFVKNSEQILTLRVNEILDGKNRFFAESQAECLVEKAIEHLKTAHEKVQSAELAKCAAEAELEQYRHQVTSQIEIKIRQIEEKMEWTASQLAAAEQKSRVAEERANQAETLVGRLKAELQTQMMRARPRLVRTAA